METSSAAASVVSERGLFFGWRVVAALFVCVLSLIGVSLYGFIILASPLAHKFGWNAAEMGAAISVMWVTAPLALLAGPIIRRIGPWRLVICGMLIQVAVLAVMGFVDEVWQIYALRMTMGVGKIMIMASAPVIVAIWFDLRFATAMSIVWAGGGAGGILLAPITERLVTAFGWETATAVLSGGMLGALLLALILARGPSSPRDIGRVEDGRPAGARSDAQARAHAPLSVAEARASIDWGTAALMAIAVVGSGACAIGFQALEPTVFGQLSLSSEQTADLLGLFAGAATVSSVVYGWLLDRFSPTACSFGVIAMFLLAIVGLFQIGAAPEFAIAAFSVGMLGLTLGAGEVLWIALFKRQFGVAAFATTYGIFYFSYQVGSGMGGFIMGWSVDRAGYTGFITATLLLYVPAMIISVWRPRFKKTS